MILDKPFYQTEVSRSLSLTFREPSLTTISLTCFRLELSQNGRDDRPEPGSF